MARNAPDLARRRKRRRRRVQILVIYTAIAIGLAWFFESQATTTMIFVRHAEKVAEPVDDPPLSADGRRRVAELTRQLVEADVIAGVDAIYVTNTLRSEQTAEPLARRLGIEMQHYQSNPEDNEAVVDSMVANNKGKIILVVGHSDTLPSLIADLGASKNVPPIADNEYDNLYIVSIPWFGKTKTIRMRYGEPYRPAAMPGEAVPDMSSAQDERI